MVQITKMLSIPDEALQERFVRSPGPGGQHVNKSATAVELRFDAKNCPAINPTIFARLRRISGQRMTKDGEIVIHARRFRSQDDNRKDARQRLIRLLRRAVQAPKRRKATRPPRASRERRLESKKARGQRKALRQAPKSE